jgi:hypothetical protein
LFVELVRGSVGEDEIDMETQQKGDENKKSEG